MATAPYGALVMAYGGPNSIADVEPYLLDVRGFRPTPPAIVAEVRARYAAIGGRSPIREQTEAQSRALAAALTNGRGSVYPVAVGMRHWEPRIPAALAQLRDAGVRRAVGLVMAPHYSRLSIELYFKQIEAADQDLEIAPIQEWHLLPEYLQALATRIAAALERFPKAVRPTVPIVYTAHSLPERILTWQDPYPAQLAATVAALRDLVGPDRPQRLAYQSAAMTPESWLGPDAGAVIEELAAAGHRHVLIAPIGFTTEHVEILYDVDIVLQQRARELGVQLERIAMVGDDATMVAGLARLVRQAAEQRGWR